MTCVVKFKHINVANSYVLWKCGRIPNALVYQFVLVFPSQMLDRSKMTEMNTLLSIITCKHFAEQKTTTEVQVYMMSLQLKLQRLTTGCTL